MNTMMFVILACMKPWVRKRAKTERIKDFRLINCQFKMGFSAFFSAYNNPKSERKDATKTIKNHVDDMPKFCPKDGRQSTKLKKMNTQSEPAPSKFENSLLMAFSFPWVMRQSRNMTTEIATQTHTIMRQP